MNKEIKFVGKHLKKCNKYEQREEAEGVKNPFSIVTKIARTDLRGIATLCPWT